jgi:hypothetical protein
MYRTEDKLDTHGHMTIRMTCVAMSKLCSHGAHHSRFALDLAGLVILRPPASANATILPPSTRAVLDQALREAVVAATGVFTGDYWTSSRGSPVSGIRGSGWLRVDEVS